MRRRRCDSAIAALLAIGLTAPLGAFAQNAQVQAAAVLGSKPNPDGTPVPRTPDGKADLSGIWNKRLITNTTAALEPLPFTPEGLKV
jgi:hypothetical protein